MGFVDGPTLAFGMAKRQFELASNLSFEQFLEAEFSMQPVMSRTGGTMRRVLPLSRKSENRNSGAPERDGNTSRSRISRSSGETAVYDQRSASTGRHVFYPRIMAPGTGETDLEFVAASGHGTVYSTTVVRQKPPTPCYNVALIDLAEGPRMMARVIGLAADDVRIGMHVKARIIEEEGAPLVVFEPA
ncbi:MAG: OB-fold domain-containing protein [Rhodospirillales bacterium]